MVEVVIQGLDAVNLKLVDERLYYKPLGSKSNPRQNPSLC